MRLSTILALIFSVCLVGRAEGQTAVTPKTWPALFGGAEARGVPEREGGLDLTAELFGGYDDDVLAGQGGGGPRLASTAAGFSSGLEVGFQYARPGLLYASPAGRGDFRAWGNSSIRHYPSLDDLTGTYLRFGLELSAPLNRRLTLYASPRADYSPRYSLRLFPDPLQVDPETGSMVSDPIDVPAPEGDYSVIQANSFRYGATTSASIVVGTYSTLVLDYAYTKRESDVPTNDVEIHGAGVSLDHRFTRNASLSLGYSFQEGNHRSGLTTRAQTIDIGINYQKPLSRTRKTFLRFNTGSTAAETGAGQRIQATGSASLVHHVGRTWTGIAEYRRQLRYVDGFDRPIFADTVSTGMSGLITRRIELAVRASYFSGTIGVSRRSPRFDSYAVSGRLRRALTRRLAAYGEYVFYRYEFDEDAMRPVGLPPKFNRNGIRFGLSLWIPVTD